MSKPPRKIFNITCSGHGRELFLYLFPRIKKGSLSTMMELCLSSSIGNDTLFCLFHRGINQTTQFILLIYQQVHMQMQISRNCARCINDSCWTVTQMVQQNARDLYSTMILFSSSHDIVYNKTLCLKEL